MGGGGSMVPGGDAGGNEIGFGIAGGRGNPSAETQSVPSEEADVAGAPPENEVLDPGDNQPEGYETLSDDPDDLEGDADPGDVAPPDEPGNSSSVILKFFVSHDGQKIAFDIPERGRFLTEHHAKRIAYLRGLGELVSVHFKNLVPITDVSEARKELGRLVLSSEKDDLAVLLETYKFERTWLSRVSEDRISMPWGDVQIGELFAAQDIKGLEEGWNNACAWFKKETLEPNVTPCVGTKRRLSEETAISGKLARSFVRMYEHADVTWAAAEQAIDGAHLRRILEATLLNEDTRTENARRVAQNKRNAAARAERIDALIAHGQTKAYAKTQARAEYQDTEPTPWLEPVRLYKLITSRILRHPTAS